MGIGLTPLTPSNTLAPQKLFQNKITAEKTLMGVVQLF